MKQTGTVGVRKNYQHLAILNSHVFHFVTLLEYIRTNKQDPTDWFLFVYYESDRRDLLRVYTNYLRQEGFGNYRFFPMRVVEGKISRLNRLRTIAAMAAAVLVGWGTITVGTLLIGNYKSQLVRIFPHLLRYRELIYLDEGDSTLTVARERSLANWRNRFDFTGFPRVATFFTRYPELQFGPLDRVIPCDYTHTLRRARGPVDTQKVIFLGTALPRYKYMTEETYTGLVLAIARSYAERGIAFLYKAHRMEGKSLLTTLKAGGVELVQDDRPVELYLGAMDKLPLHIASFVTTAFSTLSSIFGGDLRIVAYHLSDDYFAYNQAHFSSQYAYYAEHHRRMNIELADLPPPLHPKPQSPTHD